MKRILVILIAVLAGDLAAAAASSAPVPSSIQQVTVYADRARVMRSATAEVISGMNTIQIEVAAFRLEPESVMARVFGDGELYGVQYRQIPVADKPQKNIQSLEERVRDLSRTIDALIRQKEVLDKRRAFLDSFVEFSKVQVPRELQTRLPEASTLENILSFLERGYTDANTRQPALDNDIDARQREMEVARRELAALQGGGRRQVQMIEILFQSRRAQTVRIEAEYQVAGAAWRPLYKAAVPEAADRVALTLFASIRQKSGEDWQAVHLAVSNALPLAGARLPDLDPWIVDLPRPAPMRRMEVMAMSKAAVPQAEADAVQSAAPAEEEATLAQAKVRRSALAVQYDLPQAVAVDSRDKETLLPVFTRTLKGKFYHLAVPKIRPTAFLVCQSAADSELLAGPMQVYFAGQYLGKTGLEEMRAGGTFDLNLGADRAVLVRREKVTDKRRETFFGQIERDTVVRDIVYRILLENLKDQPVTVELVDHVPVSRTDRIRIADLAFDPPPDRPNDQGREGVMRWERRLAPGQQDTVKIQFTVSYPKEMGVPDF